MWKYSPDWNLTKVRKICFGECCKTGAYTKVIIWSQEAGVLRKPFILLIKTGLKKYKLLFCQRRIGYEKHLSSVHEEWGCKESLWFFPLKKEDYNKAKQHTQYLWIFAEKTIQKEFRQWNRSNPYLSE